MIDPASFSYEWLDGKQKKYHKDPGIMESMIYALYLLEQLKLTGLEFIFKGGTSLLLLMENPARFSIDIDIIVSPETNKEKLEEYLLKIAIPGVFIRMELDERRSYKGDISKAHYKFIFNSIISNKNKEGEVILNPEREILLDVLFVENHYPSLVEMPLQTEWVLMKDGPIVVITPDINSITGDKLAAFAPTTIGVSYNADKEKEIIKQLFDVGSLFNLLTDLGVFRKSFETIAISEIKYRPERNISIEDVLNDTIKTGIILARRDKQIDEDSQAKYNELIKGINQFKHFIYIGNFRIEEAQVASAKAAYLAAIILTDFKEELKKFDENIPLTEYMITHPDYNFFNKRLKFVAKGEALFYWCETITLLYPKRKTGN